MNTRGKWTNEALDDAMNVVESETTSLQKGIGTRTYTLYILSHCLITCTKKNKIQETWVNGCVNNRGKLGYGCLDFGYLGSWAFNQLTIIKDERGKFHSNKGNNFS